MTIKQRKLTFLILSLYTALILYFMFLGFNRTDALANQTSYYFNLVPTGIPLQFPTLSDFTYFSLWFFNFGNFAAFIPFGIIIPILYRTKFLKFITLFFVSILILETIQMLTFLGSFDMNDATLNTLGAAVGFGAYKIGFRSKNMRKNLTFTFLSILILSMPVFGFSELINKSLTKKEDSPTVLHELKHIRNVVTD